MYFMSKTKMNGKALLKTKSPQASNKQKLLLEGEKILNKYHPLKVVGRGTFGIVFTARDPVGDLVAVKKIREDPSHKNREVELLTLVKDCPNIVSIKNSFRTSQKNQKDTFLHIVMNYIPSNIQDLALKFRSQKQYMPILYVKLFAFQMFTGLHFLHKSKIIHRDIKPQNLLIDEETCELHICDFGSAKKYVSDEKNVSYIASRYYRAPELIYDCQFYSTAVDIWAAGCVISEMLLAGQPLFMSDSSAGQLVQIARAIGPPNEEDLMSFRHNIVIKLPPIEKVGLKKCLPEHSPSDIVYLLREILIYNVKMRPTAKECMQHACFDELFENKELKLLNGNPLPVLKRNPDDK